MREILLFAMGLGTGYLLMKYLDENKQDTDDQGSTPNVSNQTELFLVQLNRDGSKSCISTTTPQIGGYTTKAECEASLTTPTPAHLDESLGGGGMAMQLRSCFEQDGIGGWPSGCWQTDECTKKAKEGGFSMGVFDSRQGVCELI